jgi:hypothetical protein
MELFIYLEHQAFLSVMNYKSLSQFFIYVFIFLRVFSPHAYVIKSLIFFFSSRDCGVFNPCHHSLVIVSETPV